MDLDLAYVVKLGDHHCFILLYLSPSFSYVSHYGIKSCDRYLGAKALVIQPESEPPESRSLVFRDCKLKLGVML